MPKAFIPAIAAIAIAFGGTALAASPPTVGGPGSASAAAATRCERGFTYTPARRTCVSIAKGTLSDAELYRQGYALAMAGHYANALDALLAVKNPDDSRVLTMIGFAKRKSGEVEESMAYYAWALDLDPESVDAREYLGEAFVDAGRLDEAKGQLAAIERLCGDRQCEQYKALAAAIAGERRE
jgi:tetratricopeptide (TPR) repeat protein